MIILNPTPRIAVDQHLLWVKELSSYLQDHPYKQYIFWVYFHIFRVLQARLLKLLKFTSSKITWVKHSHCVYWNLLKLWLQLHVLLLIRAHTHTNKLYPTPNMYPRSAANLNQNTEATMSKGWRQGKLTMHWRCWWRGALFKIKGVRPTL